MKRLIGSVFLVAGTAIGAGMLALPASAGLSGFFPAAAIFFALWCGLVTTALYMIEVALHVPKGSNMITMANQTLGSFGKSICAVVYIFLLYALVSAYLAGGASAVHGAMLDLFGQSIPFSLSLSLFCLIFGFFIYLGTAMVDRLNRWLMCGLLATFIVMTFSIAPHVKPANLLGINKDYIWSGIAVAVTSFGFHIVIPTLCDYLDRRDHLVRRAIWIGSFLALALYLFWNALVLGILPFNVLQLAFVKGVLPANLIEAELHSNRIGVVASFFAFFAIITSFLGVSMSLLDFIADGFKIKKSRIGRLALCFLVFVPPLLFVLIDSTGFYTALKFGGILVTILLGILPPLMALAQRKNMGKKGYHVPGGAPLIYGTLLFFTTILIICIVDVI